MPNTTIRHKFELNSVIQNGNARATVLAVSTDTTGMASYLISIYRAYDGVWSRHWVMELELAEWIQKERANDA